MPVDYEVKFWEALEDLFAGAQVEGKSGYVNLLRVKRKYFSSYLKPRLSDYIAQRLKDYPGFAQELYTKLYQFFHRYFSESGSIYYSYTPLYYRVYEKVYDNGQATPRETITFNTDYEQILSDREDVSLFWKTHMLYYIKTDRIIRSMIVQTPGVQVKFFFDASGLELKQANEKRLLIYSLQGIKPDGTIVLHVNYSQRGRKTKKKEIIKQVRKAGYAIEQKTLDKAIRTFEKQTNVDYFINKDAEGFLKSQFDLWLYQYLFSQDVDFDVERHAQIKALKDIAYKTIELIAQFEDELREIWEKPRLVLSSDYLMTLGRIAQKDAGLSVVKKIVQCLERQHKAFRDNLNQLDKIRQNYPSLMQVLENYSPANQLEDWYLLNIIDQDFNPSDILQQRGNKLSDQWRYLPVDTKFFPGIKNEILQLFDNYHDHLDAWLIKSENWQALNTIMPRFRSRIKAIYIDPPYNTGGDEFIYEDKFRSSSYLTMIDNRVSLANELLGPDGIFFCSIANNANYYKESYKLGLLFDRIFDKRFADLVWKRRSGSGSYTISDITENHEYILVFGREKATVYSNILTEKELKNYEKDEDGNLYTWKSLVINQYTKEQRPNMYYGVVYDTRQDKIIFDKEKPTKKHEVIIYPPRNSVFAMTKESLQQVYDRGVVGVFKTTKGYEIKLKKFLFDDNGIVNGRPLSSFLEEERLPWKVGHTSTATREIKNLFGTADFPTPKPTGLLKLLFYVSTAEGDTVLDFFAGSGSSAQAIMDLNFDTGQKRKFVLIEMASYFDTILLPRVKKLLFSLDWKDGKPLQGRRLGGFIKYYSLEQYEQILRTVDYEDNDIRSFAQKLEEVQGRDFNFTRVSPFLFDRKLLKAVKVKDGKMIIDLKKLYPEPVDIEESLWLQNLEPKEDNIIKLLII